MPSPEVEEFAQQLIEYVRDRTIRSCDAVLKPQAQHVKAQAWRKAARHGDLNEIAQVLIPDIVDYTIFYLLHAIDNEFNISFTASNGKLVNLQEDGLGELAGWYIGGEDGWLEMYSKERVADYRSDGDGE
ncbi:MAG TPA: hypothetical protein VME24_01955 [Alphaproteobacteria bacterium]|nr:hypothetical protein [Alphaproteobacteria bacterium]